MEKEYKSIFWKLLLSKKNIISVFLFTIISFLALIIFSPYRQSKPIQYSIEINAPAEKVFRFLGNSANASHWSVFVNHITPSNNQEVADGQIGSIRRCFVDANEQGTYWDEKIIEVIPNRKRQLTVYNLNGFPLTAEHLATEQIYEPISENKCKLTFALIYKNTPTLGEKLKTYIASYRIISIFEGNLNNVKRLVEQEVQNESNNK